MLSGWRLTRAEEARPPAARAAMTPGAVRPAVAGDAMGAPTAVSTAIPFETAVPTPISIEPAPTIPPGAVVELIGPPAGSHFPVDASISFYWRWPFVLDENQQFVVYLLQDQQEILLGMLTEPNLGNDAYYLSGELAATAVQAGAVQWEVRLENAPGQIILATSERRGLLLSGRSGSRS